MELPPLIIETVNQQNNKLIKKSPLSDLIEQANFISELQSLYQYKKVNQQEYKLACEENLTCEQDLTYAIDFYHRSNCKKFITISLAVLCYVSSACHCFIASGLPFLDLI